MDISLSEAHSRQDGTNQTGNCWNRGRCGLGIRDPVTVSLCRHRSIGPYDTVTACMTLHIGFAAIADHLFAAITFRLGHLFAWHEARKLGGEDR